MSQEGENITFRREGGITNVFGPKYRPLLKIVTVCTMKKEGESVYAIILVF